MQVFIFLVEEIRKKNNINHIFHIFFNYERYCTRLFLMFESSITSTNSYKKNPRLMY